MKLTKEQKKLVATLTTCQEILIQRREEIQVLMEEIPRVLAGQLGLSKRMIVRDRQTGERLCISQFVLSHQGNGLRLWLGRVNKDGTPSKRQAGRMLRWIENVEVEQDKAADKKRGGRR